MTEEKTEKFLAWLDAEEKKRGWTDNKLSVTAKISSSVLSRARSGVLPKWDACVAIAAALNVSEITVFRKAGLLSSHQPEDEVTFEDWKAIIGQMSPEDQQEMREVALIRIERRKKSDTRPRPTTGSLKPRTSEK